MNIPQFHFILSKIFSHSLNIIEGGSHFEIDYKV